MASLLSFCRCAKHYRCAYCLDQQFSVQGHRFVALGDVPSATASEGSPAAAAAGTSPSATHAHQAAGVADAAKDGTNGPAAASSRSTSWGIW